MLPVKHGSRMLIEDDLVSHSKTDGKRKSVGQNNRYGERLTKGDCTVFG